MADDGPARPRQVSVSAGIGIFGCLILLLGLFDTMGSTRSVDARRSVTDFLAEPPGNGLGVDADRMLELWRIVIMGAGALAAAGLVLGVYLFQRHNGARIAFTVAAGLLLLAMPAIGIMPVVVAVAAVGLWSEQARDWFAGRKPRPVSVGRVDRPSREESTADVGAQVTAWMSQQPPPSPYPYGSEPTPGSGPGAADQPAGEPSHPPQQAPQPPQQPAYPPPPPYGAPPQGWQQPPPGYPPPYQQYPPQGGPQNPFPDKRPASVLIAVIVTWVSSAITGAVLLVVAVLAASSTDFEREIQGEIDSDEMLRDLDLTADQLTGYIVGFMGVFVFWCLAAIVLGFFVLRRHSWARIMLAVSAGFAAALSLLGILGIVPVLTLIPSVATLVLLFTKRSNAWFSRRQGQPGQAGPPVYAPPPGGKNQPW